MPTPLEDHVRAVLLERDRGRRMFEALSSAWAEFKAKYPERGSWQRKSTSRNVFWEVARKHLKRMALDDDGFEAIEHRDTLSVLMEDEVLARLKHAAPSLATQNVPTVEAREYDDHDRDLFGRPGIQRVRLCYVLNKYETEIIWVGVAAHNKGKFLWKIELRGDGAAVVAPDLFADVQDEQDTKSLMRPKRSVDDDAAKDDSAS